MKKLYSSIMLLITIASSIVFGQASRSENIRPFPSNKHQSEVHLSINKVNPLNIIMSFNVENIGGNEHCTICPSTQGYAVSTDGGITFTGSDLAPNNQPSYCDPATAFDADGRGYIATLSPFMNSGCADPCPNGYLIQNTTNNGSSWSNYIYGFQINEIGRSIDREMIFTVDEVPTSSFSNRVYSAWTSDLQSGNIVVENFSTDEGNNWSEPPQSLSTNPGKGACIQTGPNGEVYVCWADYYNHDQFESGNASHIGFARSTDGGAAFDIKKLAFGYLGIGSDPNHCLFNIRMNDCPSIAVDKSCGKHHGYIYIAYPCFNNEESLQSVIRVKYSPDQGNSWYDTQPINFNINITNNKHNFFPWIAVDDMTGMVSVIYYNGIDTNIDCNLIGLNFSTNTYVAYSIDGTNWNNILVSTASHLTGPISAGNGQTPNIYAGDYIGITSYGGKAYAAWMDNRSYTGAPQYPKWQIWFSIIDFSIGGNITSSLTDLDINSPSVLTGLHTYQAYDHLTCSYLNPVAIGSDANIDFKAREGITLYPGFSTLDNTQFLAEIDNDIVYCQSRDQSSIKKENSILPVYKKIISENDKINDFYFYPNPAKDYLIVGGSTGDYHKIDVSISDISGKIYYSGPPDEISKEKISKLFNIQNLSAGEYFINFALDNSNKVLKFIKE